MPHLLIALALTACAPSDDDAAQLPPPPALTTGPLIAGAPVTVTLAGVPPGASVRLAWSDAAQTDAWCPPTLAPDCLDLRLPLRDGGVATADASGVAQITVAALPEGPVALQAVVRKGRRHRLTPVLSATVSPAQTGDPCGFPSGHALMFVTSIPIPEDFGTRVATFGNHRGSPQYAGRGGDLWVRYPDGALRNLTAEAGMGLPLPDGREDPAATIAVREPEVHWSGRRALVSIATGGHTGPWNITERYWQLYEVTGFCPGETPTFTHLPLPADYNHVSPVYGSDDRVIFTSDMPPGGPGDRHLWPLRDEYEGNPINSGLWSLDPASGEYHILEHSPSGSFGPLVASDGRVVFTRWDHLKRDEDSPGDSRPIFDWQSEAANSPIGRPGTWSPEVFPEQQSTVLLARVAAGQLPADFAARYGGNDFGQFFPWQILQDGTGEETLNHVGRQELGGNYGLRSRPDDPSLTENFRQFAANQDTAVLTDQFGLRHLAEDPTHPGRFYGTIGDEFNAKSGGQLVFVDGAASVNPDDMQITFVTHRATRSALTVGAPVDPHHSGLYRDPLVRADGSLVAVWTPPVARSSDADGANRDSPRADSAYAWRLVTMTTGPDGTQVAGPLLTPGITRTIRFAYNGGNFDRTYAGVLWELEPVEVVARPRPPLLTAAVDPIEARVIQQAGADVADLRAWLAARDLAIVVSRDVTQRDHHDQQQPYNLRVPGGPVSTAPGCDPAAGCRVYDVTHLQLFTAAYLRGLDWAWRPDDPAFNPLTFQPTGGRRVLGRPLDDAATPDPGTAPGSVRLAADGSVAAIVPAGRALSWQLIDEAQPGDPHTGTDAVVRERYWITLQPGEIRSCPACHGVNTTSQTGDPQPTNEPEALRELVAWWAAGMP